MIDPGEAGLWRVLERVDGVLGELVLRERDTADGVLTDLVCNGVQVMDDADAGSEVALATGALDALATGALDALATGALDALGDAARAAPGLRVLVGGLGMGFTVQALLADPRLGERGRVVVVEVEPAVVRWNRVGRFPATAGVLDDPRVVVRTGDVADVLAGDAAAAEDAPTRGGASTAGSVPAGDVPAAASPAAASPAGAVPAAAGDDVGPGAGLDAVLLDVDNGPGFLVAASNADLYGARGLAVAAAALRPGGVLAVWSAQAAPALGAAMSTAVGPARAVETVVEREGRPLRYWVHLAVRR